MAGTGHRTIDLQIWNPTRENKEKEAAVKFVPGVRLWVMNVYWSFLIHHFEHTSTVSKLHRHCPRGSLMKRPGLNTKVRSRLHERSLRYEPNISEKCCWVSEYSHLPSVYWGCIIVSPGHCYLHGQFHYNVCSTRTGQLVKITCEEGTGKT